MKRNALPGRQGCVLQPQPRVYILWGHLSAVLSWLAIDMSCSACVEIYLCGGEIDEGRSRKMEDKSGRRAISRELIHVTLYTSHVGYLSGAAKRAKQNNNNNAEDKHCSREMQSEYRHLPIPRIHGRMQTKGM